LRLSRNRNMSIFGAMIAHIARYLSKYELREMANLKY
jgi:hypothetical protein